jgi:hypothetical protein
VRFISGARQRDWLPCVFYRAHSKEKTHDKSDLCRAFYFGRTAKKKHTASKLFAVRQKKTHGKESNARQT